MKTLEKAKADIEMLKAKLKDMELLLKRVKRLQVREVVSTLRVMQNDCDIMKGKLEEVTARP